MRRGRSLGQEGPDERKDSQMSACLNIGLDISWVYTGREALTIVCIAYETTATHDVVTVDVQDLRLRLDGYGQFRYHALSCLSQ